MIVYHIREELRRQGKTAQQMYNDIGVTMVRFEGKGKSSVHTDTIEKVCKYLNVEPGDIMEYVDDEEYEKSQKSH